MFQHSASRVREICTIGRVSAVIGMAIACGAMIRVFDHPARLGGWAALLTLGVILLAFIADRFLCSVMDRLDRFEAGNVPLLKPVPREQARDAA